MHMQLARSSVSGMPSYDLYISMAAVQTSMTNSHLLPRGRGEGGRGGNLTGVGLEGVGLEGGGKGAAQQVMEQHLAACWLS